MAKQDNIQLSDLLAGLKNNNLKMNASIEAQLKSQLNVEKFAKEDKNLQLLQSAETLKVIKKEDEVEKDLKKGLLLKTGDGLNSNVIKLLKVAKETQKLSLDQRKDILDKTGRQKEFKSIGQRLGGVKEGVKDFFTMRGFLDKTGIVKRGSGGIFSNALDASEAARNKAQARIASGERARDPKTGRIMGADASAKAFAVQAKQEQGLRRQQGDLTRKIDKYKDAGLNNTQISQTKEYKALMKLADEFAKVDPMGHDKTINPVTGVEEDGRIKAGPKTPNVDLSEEQVEQTKIQNDQLDTLHKIEENTRKMDSEETGSKSDGSGILAGLGKGIGALGKGIGAGITGISKGIAAFGKALGSLGKGIGQGIAQILMGIGEGLVGLAVGLVALTPAIPVILALSVAAMALGEALNLAAPAIEAFAPVLIKIADVIGGIFIEAIKTIPAVLGAVGDIINVIGDNIIKIMDKVVDSIERLAKIDPLRLLGLGSGLIAVSAGLAAFGAANAVAGIGNLVGGFLSAATGQKTPIEQLEQIAAFGPNLNQAGTGVKNLAKGLSDFSSIDADKIKSIAALPIEKIAVMGKAMSSANRVYDESGKNASAKESKPASTPNQTVISSPTTTVNKTTQHGFFKSPIRNTDNTVLSYFKSRFVQ